jgi:hypothetical protein
MGFRLGIVGLPNAGKSTLFNALTESAAAEAANYPFTTIEPNVGDVPVPDPRLERIAAIAGSPKVTPTRLTFVDIAGLVRGASKGEGLGNQFLAHIREVDAIALVLRCFEDPDVVHVEGHVDPITDADIIATELMLADLESLERRVVLMDKRAKSGDKEARLPLAAMMAALEALRAGKPARSVTVSDELRAHFSALNLLTAKPLLYIANVDEASAARGNGHSVRVAAHAKADGAGYVLIAAKIEAELAHLPKDERKAFLDSLGLAEPGLHRLIRAGYALLDLLTFFTAGPKEARSWTVTRGTKAPQAAGVIHSDFERGFIRAEVIAYDDYVALGGEQGARDAGKMRLEGKDYVVQDGDVIYFRFAT